MFGGVAFLALHPIDALNRSFYREHADRFIRKRAHPWPGWKRACAGIGGRPRVLDVGCGHGRFLRHWIESHGPNLEYVGVDFSPELLKESQRQTQGLLRAQDRVRFLEGDVCEIDLPPGPFDLIVAFGLLHHVAEASRRKDLVRRLAARAGPDGRVVVTVWRVAADPRLAGKSLPPPSKPLPDDEGRLLSFDGVGRRYVVAIPEEEVASYPAVAGRAVADRFFSDGATNDLNLYLVLEGSATPSSAS